MLLFRNKTNKLSDFSSKTFTDLKSTEEAVTLFCQTEFHPVYIDSKKKVASYSRKVKADSAIHSLPPDAIYACR